MSKDPRYSVESMLADGDIHLKKGRVLLWTTSGVSLTYDNHFKLSMLSHGCPMFYVISMPLTAIDTPFGEGKVKVGVSGIKKRGTSVWVVRRPYQRRPYVREERSVAT